MLFTIRRYLTQTTKNNFKGLTIEELKQRITENNCLDLHIANYKLSGDDLCSILNALHENCSIGDVDLSGNEIDHKTANQLQATLQINKSIHTLRLNNCQIDTKGLNIIAQGLSRNTSVIYVSLANNGIKDHECDFEKSLTAIAKNTSLRKIDFTGNILTNSKSLSILNNRHMYEVVFPGMEIGTKFFAPKAKL